MLKLETFTELDFDRLIDWFNSKKELTQFAASLFKFPLTRNQLFTYINTTDLYPYKIIHMESKKIIGHCELNFQNEIPRLSRILIGDKQYIGMGYGKKTIKLMIHQILNLRPETNKVDLRVFKWNENAIKLYLKLGFKIIPNNTLTFNYSKNETWVDMNMQKQLKYNLMIHH